MLLIAGVRILRFLVVIRIFLKSLDILHEFNKPETSSEDSDKVSKKYIPRVLRGKITHKQELHDCVATWAAMSFICLMDFYLLEKTLSYIPGFYHVRAVLLGLLAVPEIGISRVIVLDIMSPWFLYIEDFFGHPTEPPTLDGVLAWLPLSLVAILFPSLAMNAPPIVVDETLDEIQSLDSSSSLGKLCLPIDMLNYPWFCCLDEMVDIEDEMKQTSKRLSVLSHYVHEMELAISLGEENDENIEEDNDVVFIDDNNDNNEEDANNDEKTLRLFEEEEKENVSVCLDEPVFVPDYSEEESRTDCEPLYSDWEMKKDVQIGLKYNDNDDKSLSSTTLRSSQLNGEDKSIGSMIDEKLSVLESSIHRSPSKDVLTTVTMDDSMFLDSSSLETGSSIERTSLEEKELTKSWVWVEDIAESKAASAPPAPSKKTPPPRPPRLQHPKPVMDMRSSDSLSSVFVPSSMSVSCSAAVESDQSRDSEMKDSSDSNPLSKSVFLPTSGLILSPPVKVNRRQSMSYIQFMLQQSLEYSRMSPSPKKKKNEELEGFDVSMSSTTQSDKEESNIDNLQPDINAVDKGDQEQPSSVFSNPLLQSALNFQRRSMIPRRMTVDSKEMKSVIESNSHEMDTTTNNGNTTINHQNPSKPQPNSRFFPLSNPLKKLKSKEVNDEKESEMNNEVNSEDCLHEKEDITLERKKKRLLGSPVKHRRKPKVSLLDDPECQIEPLGTKSKDKRKSLLVSMKEVRRLLDGIF